MQQLKYVIKLTVAYLLFYSGIHLVLRRVILKNKIVVLMFHRVLNDNQQKESFSHPGIIVRSETFSKQMKYLKKHFHVLSENELCNTLDHGSSSKGPSCFITFDDGWLDNFTNAYPVLKELELPATIFLATSFIGSGSVFWQEQLSEAIYSLYEKANTHECEIFKQYNLEKVLSLPPHFAKVAIRNFVSEKKDLHTDELQRFLYDFFSQHIQHSKHKSTIDNFIDWKHVTEMARNGISFGSHSRNHPILTKTPLYIAAAEIIESKQEIEEKVGIRPHMFCYPNGNSNEEIEGQVAQSGYRAAFSTQKGLLDKATNRYCIPRINIHEEMTSNIPMFTMKILGLY